MEKGSSWMYGRGEGEREFVPILPVRKTRQPASRLFDSAHAPYPRTPVMYVDKYGDRQAGMDED